MSRKRKSRDAIPRNARERESQEDALAALSLARRENLSLSSAAKAEQIKRSTILKWTGSAWKKRGRDWRPEPSDRIRRPLTVPGPKGQRVPVSVRTSRAASLISRYHNFALKEWLRTGNPAVLKPFRGKRVPYGKGMKFITSPKKLRELKNAGLLDLDRSIYLHK